MTADLPAEARAVAAEARARDLIDEAAHRQALRRIDRDAERIAAGEDRRFSLLITRRRLLNLLRDANERTTP